MNKIFMIFSCLWMTSVTCFLCYSYDHQCKVDYMVEVHHAWGANVDKYLKIISEEIVAIERGEPTWIN